MKKKFKDSFLPILHFAEKDRCSESWQRAWDPNDQVFQLNANNINNKTTVIIIANMYNASIFIYSHYKETEALKN